MHDIHNVSLLNKLERCSLTKNFAASGLSRINLQELFVKQQQNTTLFAPAFSNISFFFSHFVLVKRLRWVEIVQALDVNSQLHVHIMNSNMDVFMCIMLKVHLICPNYIELLSSCKRSC